ncbi:hypothetical protein K470DRAFT_276730 [Piedraia hortae CBS 480.64]|uniref:Uncharacterized protein n=1 Tax=Piedraia hortae CBS 480.64 TaxID=1314780 RepID=A0A6A7C0U7_9PEZI|nr:hypothetical protein K470DRAFT_276730 [Piedraia hortae CBS 480.64]
MPTLEPYNPQEWSQRSRRPYPQAVSGTAASTRDLTGMEDVLPPPAPPYSPRDQSSTHDASPREMIDCYNPLDSPPTFSQVSSFPPPQAQYDRRSRDLTPSTNRLLPNGQRQQPSNSLSISAALTPTASRRATSMGPAASHMSTLKDWPSNVPLPPPPPGPPPAGPRSRSLNRYSTSAIHDRRDAENVPSRGAAVATNLVTIPPTPTDESLTMDEALGEDQGFEWDFLRNDSEPGSLYRRTAPREVTGETNDRRPRGQRAQSTDCGLDRARALMPVSSGSISRRRSKNRVLSDLSTTDTNVEARRPSPGPASTANVLTPPYTPANDFHNLSQRRMAPDSASSERFTSQIEMPLVSAGPISALESTRLDAFALQAIKRHRAFIEKEAAAASDEERLRLFSKYIVNESRLRRDRYASTYAGMAGEIVDLMRDMWRSYHVRADCSCSKS